MGAKAEGAEFWSAGAKQIPLSPREERVVPLGRDWDRVRLLEDPEALQEHIANCYAADCPYMAQRAERRLREVMKLCKTIN